MTKQLNVETFIALKRASVTTSVSRIFWTILKAQRIDQRISMLCLLFIISTNYGLFFFSDDIGARLFGGIFATIVTFALFYPEINEQRKNLYRRFYDKHPTALNAMRVDSRYLAFLLFLESIPEHLKVKKNFEQALDFIAADMEDSFLSLEIKNPFILGFITLTILGISILFWHNGKEIALVSTLIYGLIGLCILIPTYLSISHQLELKRLKCFCHWAINEPSLLSPSKGTNN